LFLCRSDYAALAFSLKNQLWFAGFFRGLLPNRCKMSYCLYPRQSYP